MKNEHMHELLCEHAELIQLSIDTARVAAAHFEPFHRAFLHCLSRCSAPVPTLVLATARSAEVADNEVAQHLLRALRQAGALLEIELGPLQAADLTALLRAAAGDEAASVTPEAAARLYRLSEGNPLFAIEALRAGLHRAASEVHF